MAITPEAVLEEVLSFLDVDRPSNTRSFVRNRYTPEIGSGRNLSYETARKGRPYVVDQLEWNDRETYARTPAAQAYVNQKAFNCVKRFKSHVVEVRPV